MGSGSKSKSAVSGVRPSDPITPLLQAARPHHSLARRKISRLGSAFQGNNSGGGSYFHEEVLDVRSREPARQSALLRVRRTTGRRAGRIRRAGNRHQPADGLRDEVVAGPLGIGSVWPEAGDAGDEGPVRWRRAGIDGAIPPDLGARHGPRRRHRRQTERLSGVPPQTSAILPRTSTPTLPKPVVAPWQPA